MGRGKEGIAIFSIMNPRMWEVWGKFSVGTRGRGNNRSKLLLPLKRRKGRLSRGD